MNLDQQTIERPKTQEELRDEIAQLESDLAGYNKTKKEQEAEFGQASADINQYVTDLKEIIIEKKSKLDGFANKPEVSTAEEIVENKFNGAESISDVEQQKNYHNKLLSKAVELNSFYTDKKVEAEETLKTTQPGTQEYIITENLIAQYDKQIKASEQSMDSNKKAIEKLETKAQY